MPSHAEFVAVLEDIECSYVVTVAVRPRPPILLSFFMLQTCVGHLIIHSVSFTL